MANDRHPVLVTIFDRSGRKKITAYDDSMWGWPNEESVTDYVMAYPAKKYPDHVVEVMAYSEKSRGDLPLTAGSLTWRFRTGRVAGQTSARLLRKSRSAVTLEAKGHHATKKKSPAQLDREIAQALTARSGLSKHQLDLLSRRKPGGGLRAGYLTPTGWHGDPMVIEDRKLRLEALREQPAPRFPKEPGRRSHSTKKSAAPKASEYTKLATATSVPRIEKYVNEYAYSTNYRVDPETLQITNPVKAPPENWFVMRYRGGYLFGRKV